MAFAHRRTNLSGIKGSAYGVEQSQSPVVFLLLSMAALCAVALFVGGIFVYGPDRIIREYGYGSSVNELIKHSDLVGEWINVDDKHDRFLLSDADNLRYQVEGAYRAAKVEFDGLNLAILTENKKRNFVLNELGKMTEDVRGYGMVAVYEKR